MKSLIKNIKYSRLPKEVLYLIDLLNYHNKHVISYTYYHEIRIGGEQLFTISDKNKSIKPYYIRAHVHLHLHYSYEQSQMYTASMIKGFVNDAISNSKYADYKII